MYLKRLLLYDIHPWCKSPTIEEHTVYLSFELHKYNEKLRALCCRSDTIRLSSKVTMNLKLFLEKKIRFIKYVLKKFLSQNV